MVISSDPPFPPLHGGSLKITRIVPFITMTSAFSQFISPATVQGWENSHEFKI